MANPSVTYTFTNTTTADGTQVSQNFTDLINGMTDGTKSFSIDALTVAGAALFNGAVTLGNATGDDITITGSLAATVPIKTDNAIDAGSSSKAFKIVYAREIQGSSTAGTAIYGRTSGAAPSAGYLGERLVAAQSTATTVSSVAANGNWGDMVALTLTAGIWDMNAVAVFSLNGATATMIDTGISNNPGNDASGLVYGDSVIEDVAPVGTILSPQTIAGYRASVSTATTYYHKVNAAFSAGTPKFRCRLSATRVA